VKMYICINPDIPHYHHVKSLVSHQSSSSIVVLEKSL
jgi:hypothetical protein